MTVPPKQVGVRCVSFSALGSEGVTIMPGHPEYDVLYARNEVAGLVLDTLTFEDKALRGPLAMIVAQLIGEA